MNKLTVDRNYWRGMFIAYLICVILDVLCVIVHTIELIAAIAISAATFWLWLSPILWLLCAVSWIILAVMAGKELHRYNKILKENVNE